MNKIPWILHQTYKTKEIPDKWKVNYESWRKIGDPWDFVFYLDNDLRQVIVNHYPEFIELYDGFQHNIERIDFARYAILHKYGGVYADMDMEQISSFKPLMEKNKVLLASEPFEHSKIMGRDVMLCNACMLSNPNNPFWLAFMYHIKSYYHTYFIKLPVQTTGPLGMTLFYESIKRNNNKFHLHGKQYNLNDYFELLPSCYLFSEVKGGKQSKHCNNSKIYAVHHWSNSWVANTYSTIAKNFIESNKREIGFTVIAVEFVIIVLLSVILLIMGIAFSRKR